MKNTSPDFESVVGNIFTKLGKAYKPLGTAHSDCPGLEAVKEKLLRDIIVGYEQQGNFTIAILTHRTDYAYCCSGVSKRNAEDPRNDLRGKATALSRAIEAYCFLNKS